MLKDPVYTANLREICLRHLHHHAVKSALTIFKRGSQVCVFIRLTNQELNKNANAYGFMAIDGNENYVEENKKKRIKFNTTVLNQYIE